MVRVEGDITPEKKRIAAEVRRGVELFLSLDVQHVQDACNVERDQLLRALATYRDEDPLVPFHLPNTTAKRARQEIARPFQLVAPPRPIVINQHLDDHPLAPNAPAFVVPGDPQYVGIIFVLANNIDPVGLCARDTRQPLVDVALHEMLHLSGDAVKSEDGVVRHQLAGTEVIRTLLGMPRLLP
ncbi:MAG: hypothetical protein HYY45_19765 [Deltaproteobacteria bacterium]|nr:hypothetical protein [Deltaproteobacteria bacterium]